MFKNINQAGLICIFDADLEFPLKLWNKKIREGQIKRNVSDDVKGLVLELKSKLPLNNYINCPVRHNQTLGILYPYFNMIVKLPTSSFFAFDIQVLDDKSIRRRLRVSTVQTFVDIHPFMCKLPLTPVPGWNHIMLPIHQFLKDIYGTNYVQTLRLAVYSNCILKKIYFSDKDYPEEDTPPEFHLEDPDSSDKYRLKYTALMTKKHGEHVHEEETAIRLLLFSNQIKPLKQWNKKIRGGHINQVHDKEIHCGVLEICSFKSTNTYITCPADPKKVLGIRFPFLHFTVKNMEMPVLIEVLIRDSKNVKRRFKAFTKHSATQLKPYICKVPLTLEKGWNDVIVPLQEYTRRAYGTRYVETLRVQLHASCRIHRVYFSHRNVPEQVQAQLNGKNPQLQANQLF